MFELKILNSARRERPVVIARKLNAVISSAEWALARCIMLQQSSAVSEVDNQKLGSASEAIMAAIIELKSLERRQLFAQYSAQFLKLVD